MPRKQTVFCSKPLDYAFQQLSKNQLIDLVAEMARERLVAEGTRNVADLAIIGYVTPRLNIVWHARGDRAISLTGYMQQFVTASENYKP